MYSPRNLHASKPEPSSMVFPRRGSLFRRGMWGWDRLVASKFKSGSPRPRLPPCTLTQHGKNDRRSFFFWFVSLRRDLDISSSSLEFCKFGIHEMSYVKRAHMHFEVHATSGDAV